MHSGGSKWTDDMTIKFLELYRRRPCLWETDNPDYKCRLMRNDALTSLVEEMGIPGFDVTTCKLKIKNIRSHYCQELKKIYYSTLRKDQDGQRTIYKPSLVWFSTINSFLRNYVQQNIESDDPPMESRTDVQLKVEHDFTQNLLIKQENEEEDDNLEALVEMHHRKKKSSETYEKHKKMKKLKLFSSPESEFDVFCRSVALQLNKMPLENALRLQLGIQNLVTQERLKCLQEEQL